jgi:hypothetical protein
MTIKEISRTALLLGNKRLARTMPPCALLLRLVGCCEGDVVWDDPRELEVDPPGSLPKPPCAGAGVVGVALDVDALGAWLVVGGGVEVEGGGALDVAGGVVDGAEDVPPLSRPPSVSGTVTLRLMPPSFRPIGRTGAGVGVAELAESGAGAAAAAPAGARTASSTAVASATGGRGTRRAARWMLCMF